MTRGSPILGNPHITWNIQGLEGRQVVVSANVQAVDGEEILLGMSKVVSYDRIEHFFGKSTTAPSLSCRRWQPHMDP